LKAKHSASFSIPQRILHWLTAALVFFNLIFPNGMNVWKRAIRMTGTATPEQVAGANIHAVVGIAILILVAARIGLRYASGAPSSTTEEPTIFRVAAKLVHVTLYLVLIAMPATGAAAYYLGYSGAGDIHADILKVVLWALVGAHVLGVLVHQFYWKTNVLRRMTIG
jgi:cytochrome b561